MEKQAYSKAEVLAAGDTFPDRGLECPKCKVIIPQFAELSAEDEQRILKLIRDGSDLNAMHELRTVTGCSLRWAKIWTIHEGKPSPPDQNTSCPYCGEPLRATSAKQCRFCRRDWHDPEKLNWLDGR